MASCIVIGGTWTQSTSSVTSLKSSGYDKGYAYVTGTYCTDKCYKCLRAKDNTTILCKEETCPSPTPTPTTSGPTPSPTPTPTGTSGGGGVVVTTGVTNAIEKMYHKQNLWTKSRNPAMDKEFKDLYNDLRTKNVLVSKLLRIQREPNPDNAPERIVLWGRDVSYDRPRIYKVERGGPNNEYGWIDDEIDENGVWMPFDAYNKLDESMKQENILTEQEENSLSEMIDNKLKEFNFYTANEKGKQRVVFTDDDREEISREFDDLIKKYPEDIAFIRAVVIAKGEDKKTGEPVVRLGSYYNNANIELPFNSQMNGLGKLLDGGIIYFTILNNEGPDYRDFKIVGGDKIPEVDFNDKEKEEIETDSYVQSHNQEMEKEEPFEEVMKEKEKKGLQSLLDGEGLTNELTKRQKEVLENLKKKGFKFDKPENADIYERVRISSKEFNESINAWRPKK